MAVLIVINGVNALSVLLLNSLPYRCAHSDCQYYMKEGNRNAGSSYAKAVQTLTDLEEEVTVDNAMCFSKGMTKLHFIGKGTAEKMKEFCETGTFAKLEEKRAAHA